MKDRTISKTGPLVFVEKTEPVSTTARQYRPLGWHYKRGQVLIPGFVVVQVFETRQDRGTGVRSSARSSRCRSERCSGVSFQAEETDRRGPRLSPRSAGYHRCRHHPYARASPGGVHPDRISTIDGTNTVRGQSSRSSAGLHNNIAPRSPGSLMLGSKESSAGSLKQAGITGKRPTISQDFERTGALERLLSSSTSRMTRLWSVSHPETCPDHSRIPPSTWICTCS